MNEVISGLKRLLDSDGYMTLDHAQAQFLLFFFYELSEQQSNLKDCAALKCALRDLVGSLPSERKEIA